MRKQLVRVMMEETLSFQGQSGAVDDACDASTRHGTLPPSSPGRALAIVSMSQISKPDSLTRPL